MLYLEQSILTSMAALLIHNFLRTNWSLLGAFVADFVPATLQVIYEQ